MHTLACMHKGNADAMRVTDETNEQRIANVREWLNRMNAAIINGKPEVAAHILATQLMGKTNA